MPPPEEEQEVDVRPAMEFDTDRRWRNMHKVADLDFCATGDFGKRSLAKFDKMFDNDVLSEVSAHAAALEMIAAWLRLRPPMAGSANDELLRVAGRRVLGRGRAFG